MGYRILTVDDEIAVQWLIASALHAEEYEIKSASNGRQLFHLLDEYSFDLIVLDLVMPDIEGLEVCRRIRQSSDIPILILSGRVDEQIKISALDMGADDYVTKPFRLDEFRARVRALLRRTSHILPSKGVLSVGGLEIDFKDRTVRSAEKTARLTRIELAILVELAKCPEVVVTSENLVRRVWGLRSNVDLQNLRVHVGNLRKKIEADVAEPKHILTVTAVGYRLATETG
jgi:two-component system KDP operon response regulator KdpE